MVEIMQCNVRKLRFDDESFDFVLCWDGMIEAAKELIRITKKGGGRISMFLVNRCSAAVDEFHKEPDSALALLRSESNHIYDDGWKYAVIGVEEARKFFENQGINVIAMNAACGMLHLLSIPEKVRQSRHWNGKFFRQVAEMLLRLGKEPSVKGLSRHLVVYGDKI
jgi:SAM-dependent methyltransferase